MSDTPRPDIVNDAHIRTAVHERLHAKDGTESSSCYQIARICHSYSLETIVWETLAVLGEWEFIALDPLEKP